VIATAKIYRKHHPDHKIIFISPCSTKQNIEAPKYPECIDGVITFSQLKSFFDEILSWHLISIENIFFDSYIREYTKIYPVSGGLSSTAHFRKVFKPEEILVVDGISNVRKTLDEIGSGTSSCRFLDILNCDGGCIGGPAIVNKEPSVKDKDKLINKYMDDSAKHSLGNHEGCVDYARDVDMGRIFSRR
jgi:iron only hydrogenase large subunit-like protein